MASFTLESENERLKSVNARLKTQLDKLEKVILKGKVREYIFEKLYNGGDINVCSLDGNMTTIPVKYHTTIGDVKSHLEEKCGISKSKCELCFGGARGSSILENHRTLYHYNICVGSTVHMILKVNPNISHITMINDQHDKDINNDKFEEERAKICLLKMREFEEIHGLNSTGQRKGWTGKPSHDTKERPSENVKMSISC